MPDPKIPIPRGRKVKKQKVAPLPPKQPRKQVNIKVRTVADKDSSKRISLSSTKFNAAKHKSLHLVAPMNLAGGGPEFKRLSDDLKKLGFDDTLDEVREDNEQKDISMLQEATGWDARLIAIAAMANKLSTDTGLADEVLYALFRTGLPIDTEKLALVGLKQVAEALEKARTAGIVSLTDDDVARAMTLFTDFSKKKIR